MAFPLRRLLAAAAFFALLASSAVCAAAAKKRTPHAFADADEATLALFRGVSAGDVNLVKDALAGGARIDDNSVDEKGPSTRKQTPLMMASLIGETKIAKLLLDRGADPTIGERDGYTPLHGCAFQGRTDTCKMLLANPKVPNIVHKDGFHPMHRAIWGKSQNFADTVQVFLDFGVSPGLKSSSKAGGKSALAIAEESGNEMTVHVLKEALAAQALEAEMAAAAEKAAAASEGAPAAGEL